MQMFSYNVTKFAAPSVPGRVQLCTSNSNRVTAVVSISVTRTMWLFFSDGTTDDNAIAHYLGPGMIVMPYRDWGPILQGEIWAGIDPGTADIYFSDIFRVPSMR